MEICLDICPSLKEKNMKVDKSSVAQSSTAKNVELVKAKFNRSEAAHLVRIKKSISTRSRDYNYGNKIIHVRQMSLIIEFKNCKTRKSLLHNG